MSEQVMVIVADLDDPKHGEIKALREHRGLGPENSRLWHQS